MLYNYVCSVLGNIHDIYAWAIYFLFIYGLMEFNVFNVSELLNNSFAAKFIVANLLVN